MSSFFTIPKSQKKRKREDTAAHTSKRTKATNSKSKKFTLERDESISGSASEDEELGKKIGGEGDHESSSSEDETAAERRLRLAEQYLENIKGDVQEEVGFDAEEVDRDLIGERLQEDVASTKGRLYKHIASTLDFEDATRTHFRWKSASVTGIAVCPPYAYTVSKDISITKWELHTPPIASKKPNKKLKRPQKQIRRRPTKVLEVVGSGKKSKDPNYKYHTAPILTIAASSTGKFLATGSSDKKLIVYNAADLTPLRVFTQHRDAVTSVSFRPGTNQLYSASKDRTVKVWSLDELAYVETLFGHQDEVVDVAAYPGVERCLSVGARDRTARVWKVVEETQLVFRGGGGGVGTSKSKTYKKDGVNGTNGDENAKCYAEGSIDRVALIENDLFVTGSDNGSLCLWSLQKKKPIFIYPLAHGLEEPMKPEEASAEMHLGPDFKLPERQPRWITALASVPLADLVVSGSWDGQIRVWRIGDGKRSLEYLGVVGKMGEEGGVRGYINDIKVFERGDRGKETICIVAAVGNDHRLGRWKKAGARSGAVVWEVPQRVSTLKAKKKQSVENGEQPNGTHKEKSNAD